MDADDTEEEPDAIAAEKAKTALAKKGGRATRKGDRQRKKKK